MLPLNLTRPDYSLENRIAHNSFRVLKRYLEPYTSVSKEQAGQEILENVAKYSEPSTFRHIFSDVCVQTAEQIPCHHSAHIKLVQLIAYLAKYPEACEEEILVGSHQLNQCLKINEIIFLIGRKTQKLKFTSPSLAFSTNWMKIWMVSMQTNYHPSCHLSNWIYSQAVSCSARWRNYNNICQPSCICRGSPQIWRLSIWTHISRVGTYFCPWR